MATIKQSSDLVTQINLLKVEPENQQRLLDLMLEQAQTVMFKQPGFISINFHKSVDGTRIVNYVQWSSQELLDAAHRTPEFIAHFQKYKDLVIEGGPLIYEVVYTNEVQSDR